MITEVEVAVVLVCSVLERVVCAKVALRTGAQQILLSGSVLFLSIVLQQSKELNTNKQKRN